MYKIKKLIKKFFHQFSLQPRPDNKTNPASYDIVAFVMIFQSDPGSAQETADTPPRFEPF